MSDPILTQLAALKGASATALKIKWRALFDTEPPPYNRRFLESRLAYRIQELAYGGLKKETVERLRVLGKQYDGKPGEKAKGRSQRLPIAGTRLIRDWRGTEHSVTVRGDDFEYQGRPYKSLSAIAREITGVRWNGWLFFGLKITAVLHDQEAGLRTFPSAEAPVRRLHPQVERRGTRDGVQLARGPAGSPARRMSPANAPRGGFLFPTATTMAASPAAPWSGPRSGGCGLILRPARSTWWWSTRSIGCPGRSWTFPGWSSYSIITKLRSSQ